MEWWPEGAARALAQLSGESVNRSRLRHCGGLSLLVAAAKVNSHAMHALLQYVFDDTCMYLVYYLVFLLYITMLVNNFIIIFILTAFQILVNEGLIALLTDELIKHLTTMAFEHNVIDIDNKLNEVTNTENTADKNDIPTSSEKKTKILVTPADVENTMNLFKRRKQNQTVVKEGEDELKVVIERDNMIVGFVDTVDSDASEDSQSESEKLTVSRKGLKRSRSKSPKSTKKVIP